VFSVLGISGSAHEGQAPPCCALAEYGKLIAATQKQKTSVNQRVFKAPPLAARTRHEDAMVPFGGEFLTINTV
tara:strand:+ start:788 stop:1006 length:219 start_codon:yes stop_codon:yes gene_type:complete